MKKFNIDYHFYCVLLVLSWNYKKYLKQENDGEKSQLEFRKF